MKRGAKSSMKHSEKLAYKYKFVREQIINNYKKGCKILNIVKIIFAILFILYTFIALKLSEGSTDKSIWLVLWIIIIFADITIFLITDYCKYLMKEKVIPYLLDDDQLEFGEYDIFKDEDDEEYEKEED